jgi:hypothetical protein
MMPKIINILETVGALLIVAAFALWSGEWWQLSNKLWWAAVLIITPVIIWKNRSKSASEKVLVAIMFCCLLAISSLWFGKKDINVKIPFLPKITINR